MTHARSAALTRCIFVCAAMGLLVACAPGASAPNAGSQSIHSWAAPPVLISFGVYHDHSAPVVGPAPDLILYADGRLILRDSAGLQEANLTRQETCALLNTIERTGFLTYDPDRYRDEIRNLRFFMVSRTEIAVNAWTTSHGAYPALREFLDLKEGEQINPSLRAVYRLLSQYRPANLRPHVPERLALGLLKLDLRQTGAQPWPMNVTSLAELYRNAIANPHRTWDELRGAIVRTDLVQLSLDATSSLPIFADQNGDQYAVSARPLLPFESIQSALTPDPIIPSPDVIAGNVQVTCSPADGVLPIP